MTQLSAKVLIVDRLGDQYLITVQVSKNIHLRSMDLLSETIGRASARIGTVGWILFITKIPVFVQDSLFRSGELTSQVKLSL